MGGVACQNILIAVEVNTLAKIKHGGCGTALYNVWKSMRQRCKNRNCPDYQWYGAKGVYVCPEWGEFPKFREWAINSGYKDGLTIERKCGNGPYSPENCTWITIKEQQKNECNVLHFVVFGELHTVESACKKYGVEKPVFYDRKHKGWDLERIFSTPKTEKQGGYRPKGVHVNHG